MKVAYVFSSAGQTIDYILGDMILPQLEADCHGVDVVGMFFFHDNTFALRDGDPLGSRLVDVAEEKDIHLMLCDRCASKRGLAEQVGTDESGRAQYEPRDTFDGVAVGCFPDLYEALSGSGLDHVITL
ncbi:SaoD/DsrE family protein [Halobaculum sp. EA56]|uniref:SaoD/DsrE family protein n=1 Tax=Halobaculum sp. EA56 TaxID=3421648 RepID=UPI003EBD6566